VFPLDADLFINLPKLKTHRKTGITCALKNLVGINGDKNWLPHHTDGCPGDGGDERPSLGWADWVETRIKPIVQIATLKAPGLAGAVYRVARRRGPKMFDGGGPTIRNGNWQGNDTCWRMALDLNRALLFANRDGTLRTRTQPKRYFCIVDGIVGGQGNGPIDPDPVFSNVLIAGENPAEVDAVAARLMGFEIERLPIVIRAFDAHDLIAQPLREGRVSRRTLRRRIPVCGSCWPSVAAFGRTSARRNPFRDAVRLRAGDRMNAPSQSAVNHLLEGLCDAGRRSMRCARPRGIVRRRRSGAISIACCETPSRGGVVCR
jgi:hypothetical protein